MKPGDVVDIGVRATVHSVEGRLVRVMWFEGARLRDARLLLRGDRLEWFQ